MSFFLTNSPEALAMGTVVVTGAYMVGRSLFPGVPGLVGGSNANGESDVTNPPVNREVRPAVTYSRATNAVTVLLVERLNEGIVDFRNHDVTSIG